MPRQGDELGNRHALVSHALDVLDEVQQRRDQPQVRHRRLARQQGEDALMDLEVAAVEAVVVHYHHGGGFDVLVLERLRARARGARSSHVNSAESGLLEGLSPCWKCWRPSPVISRTSR